MMAAFIGNFNDRHARFCSPMRLPGACGNLAGSFTAQKERHTGPAFNASAERKIGCFLPSKVPV
jgi:hypothetical protein